MAHALRSIFGQPSVDAAKFKEIAEGQGLSEKLVKRRAASLKQEITKQLGDSSNLPLHERLVAANARIESFKDFATSKANGQLKTQVTDLSNALTSYVQTQTKKSFDLKAADEARKADEAFSQFQTQVKDAASQVKDSYKKALDNSQADVLAVVVQGKANISKILMINLPNASREALDLPQSTVEKLQQDLTKRALDAQMKKARNAFDAFLGNNGTRIGEQAKFLTKTQRNWAEEAEALKRAGSGRAVQVVEDLAKKGFSIPGERFYNRRGLDQEKEAVGAEMNVLHALMSFPPFEGDFAHSPAVQNFPDLKERAEQADALLKQAVEVRDLASNLTKVKSSADGYGYLRAEIDTNLTYANLLADQLKTLVPEYKPEQTVMIDGLFKTVNRKHSELTESLKTLKDMRAHLSAAIPDIDFGPLTDGVSLRLGRLETSLDLLETQFSQFQNLETRSNEGNFEGSSLNRTWSEAFLAFFSWLVSLFSCKSDAAYDDLSSTRLLATPPLVSSDPGSPASATSAYLDRAAAAADEEEPGAPSPDPLASPTSATSVYQALANA